MNPTLTRIQALRLVLSKESTEQKSHHTLGELFVLLEPLELALSGILFSAPFLQPVPVPGLSTPVGLTLAVLAVLTMSGRGHRALPRRLREHRLSAETVSKIITYTEKFLQTIQRLPHWNLGRAGRVLAHPRALGAHIVFMAILLSLPLPIPFSNTVPAWGIVFTCLAMIDANGFFILISYLLLIGNLLFFGSLIGLVWKFV